MNIDSLPVVGSAKYVDVWKSVGGKTSTGYLQVCEHIQTL